MNDLVFSDHSLLSEVGKTSLTLNVRDYVKWVNFRPWYLFQKKTLFSLGQAQAQKVHLWIDLTKHSEGLLNKQTSILGWHETGQALKTLERVNYLPLGSVPKGNFQTCGEKKLNVNCGPKIYLLS